MPALDVDVRPSKSHGSGGAAELVEPGLSAGADGRSPRLHPADDAGPIESPPPGVRDLDILDQSGNRLGTINFEAGRDAPTGQRPTSAQQAQFGEDFRRELSRLERWAAALDWRPSRIRELHVVVSDRYRISRSLVPAWYGHAGHMEFPAWRVLAGNAAIAHELVHVFFPNGNRFLAEGLAVHLQAAIGGNRAFPNFGRPLHVMARELLRQRLPGFAHRHLEALRLADLDRITAPSPLTLQVGPDFHGEEPRGQAFLYSIAGSFVQFLIEARGMARFRALYATTPLVPRQQVAGSPDRWSDVYDMPLASVESEWKSLMAGDGPHRLDR